MTSWVRAFKTRQSQDLLPCRDGGLDGHTPSVCDTFGLVPQRPLQTTSYLLLPMGPPATHTHAISNAQSPYILSTKCGKLLTWGSD